MNRKNTHEEMHNTPHTDKYSGYGLGNSNKGGFRIPLPKLTPEESKQIVKKFNNLSREGRECTYEFIGEYQEKIRQHCLQTGYAENIGGGCEHVVGYTLHVGVLEKAMNSCNLN